LEFLQTELPHQAQSEVQLVMSVWAVQFVQVPMFWQRDEREYGHHEQSGEISQVSFEESEEQDGQDPVEAQEVPHHWHPFFEILQLFSEVIAEHSSHDVWLQE
jgi:hypothetical protein